MPRKPKPPARKWRNRIVGHDEVDPEQLLANPKNWRIHPKEQQKALEGVLAEVGWVQDVIVNQRSGFVVDGHARVAMAITAGERVPVVYVDLSEKEEALILATLDPLSAMAVTDKELLGDLLKDMEVTNDAVAAMLAELSGNPVKAGLTDPDDVPDVPVAPVTRLGDLWLLGEHRVLCGDATKVADVSSLMDGALADLVFTDPPYGVGYDGGAKRRERLAGDEIGTTIYGDSLPLLQGAAADHAALYLWYADAHVAAAAAAAAGYIITAQIIWVKNNAQFVSSAHYHGKHEPCFYAHRKGKSAAWYGQKNEVTVWEVDRANRNEFHPTQKPVGLIQRAIQNSTVIGNIVLDLFGGSGSTIIGCESARRKGYMLELEPAYCDVIVQRWQNFTGKQATLEGHDGLTFEHVKEGRRREAEDALAEEAFSRGIK